jgi:hypothetical protein
VTAVRGRAAAAAAIVAFLAGSTAHAQTSATLGMSASVIEYEGYLASGAATLAPALRYDHRNISAGGQGSWTVFESGNSIVQGSGAAAWLMPVGALFGVEVSGAAGISKYADTPAGGHALGRGRLHLAVDRNGAWAGATAGVVGDGSTRSSVQMEIGLWGVRGRLAVLGTVTGTSVGPDHHIDLLGAARWTGERVDLETRVGVRPWTDSGGDIGEAVRGVFAEARALVSLGTRIALALSAGSDPADPVRRVLAARYFTAGLRLSLLPPAEARSPSVAGTTLAALRTRASAVNAPAEAPAITFEATNSLHTIRIHAIGAQSVELMADFTDWQPVALRRVEAGTWELRMAVSTGVHRLNIRIDGGEWRVPAGTREETGEFGGVVGVVVVR